VIEDATLVVETATILQVGGPAEVRVPAGAKRVDLAGKTLMPMIIDTHVHLTDTRDVLIWDLRWRAYYGVSAALSRHETFTNSSNTRQTIPGAVRFLSARRSITMPEPDAQQCLSGLRPARKAPRRSRSSQRTSSTSSRSASTQGMASTRS
jgi:predicted amidohydrolase YtcJ